MFGDEEESAKLIQLTKDFYEPQTQKSKDELRKAINEKALEIVSLSGGSDALKELREINLYENNQFFLWHTWFNDVFNRPNNCNGFDIVIANPPYIDSETMTNLGLEWERKVLMSKFKNLSGNWDIYMAFFELALSLGKTITFITPDKWLSKPFGLQFREKQRKGVCRLSQEQEARFLKMLLLMQLLLSSKKNQTSLRHMNLRIKLLLIKCQAF